MCHCIALFHIPHWYTQAFGGREERVSFLKGSARVVLFALARCSEWITIQSWVFS